MNPASDVLTTAIEGGSNYWARFGKIARYPDVTIASAEVKVWEPEPSLRQIDLGWRTIDEAAIDKAVATLRSGTVQVARRIVQALVGYETDDADIDAEVADCVLQVAMFGTILYG